MVLANFTLQDVFISKEKSDIIKTITTSSQHDHISCSALIDTGSPVTLLSEKMQRQFNLPATSLESHYSLLKATGGTLTTLLTVQVDILSDRKIWPTPAVVVSSLAHPLILGLNILQLPKSKIGFETNTVEARSKIYPADTLCIKSSTSTIIIPSSDVYRSYQLLLNKKPCCIFKFTLNTVIVLTAVASHTHCHLKHLFGKQDKSFVSPEPDLTWKELLA